jgi:signal transduction histidine kinase
MIAVAVLAAACSNTGSAAQSFLDLDARATAAQSALIEASRAAGTPGASDAWTAAVDAVEGVEAAAEEIEGIDRRLDDSVRYFARSGGYLLNLLRQGDVAEARSVQNVELGPAFSDLRAAIGGHLEGLAADGVDTTGSAANIPAGQILGGALALGVLIAAFRGLRDRRLAAARAREGASGASTTVYGPANPITASGEERGSSPSTDASRAARGGIRNADLAGVVEAALAQVEKTGWEVALDIPDFSVAADPLRLRRVIGNLLLSATSHGAEHIGIVAEEEDGAIVISIGDDGSVSEAEPVNEYGHPAEVDHQIGVARQLLAGMSAEVDWICLDGVSLYVLHLARGGVVEAFGTRSAELDIAESA